jgi:hypothetical protein
VSRYELGRLLFDACRDRNLEVVTRYREDPESVLGEYELTDVEKQYIRQRDVRSIYEAGVHPLLVRLGSLSLLGVSRAADYKDAIAGAIQRED